MSKQINRTIRSFKGALNELSVIESDKYKYDIEMCKQSIQYMINELEVEYRQLHSIGSYRSD